MNEKISNKRPLSTFLLAGLVLGALLAGAWVLSTAPVQAQDIGGPAGEQEANETDEAAEAVDVPITGPALDQASTAALDYLGEGLVTETEVGDEEGYYEIEVTLANGRQVDVHLDRAFTVLGHEYD